MPDSSDKSRAVALILAILVGVFGVHRFYAGKVGTGILMLLTLGGLGIWYIYDIVLIASGAFRDADGKRLIAWEPGEAEMRLEAPAELLEELEALRAEVAELAERVDFTERLLTKSPEDQQP